MREKRAHGKKGQVTIFIIIALVIVVIIALFFMISRENNQIPSKSENPKNYIEYCIAKETETQVARIYNNGLMMKPSANELFVLGSRNASLICTTTRPDELCVNYHPLLLGEAKRDLTAELTPGIQTCFDDLKQTFKEGYKEGNMNLSVQIKDGKIEVTVLRNIEIINKGQSLAFSVFKGVLNDNLYKFAMIAESIVNKEVNCNCPDELCWSTAAFETEQENSGYTITRIGMQIGDIANKRGAYVIQEDFSKKKAVIGVENCWENPSVP